MKNQVYMIMAALILSSAAVAFAQDAAPIGTGNTEIELNQEVSNNSDQAEFMADQDLATTPEDVTTNIDANSADQ